MINITSTIFKTISFLISTIKKRTKEIKSGIKKSNGVTAQMAIPAFPITADDFRMSVALYRPLRYFDVVLAGTVTFTTILSTIRCIVFKLTSFADEYSVSDCRRYDVVVGIEIYLSNETINRA